MCGKGGHEEAEKGGGGGDGGVWRGGQVHALQAVEEDGNDGHGGAGMREGEHGKQARDEAQLKPRNDEEHSLVGVPYGRERRRGCWHPNGGALCLMQVAGQECLRGQTRSP
ncbi:hypothetical protein GOP47_0014146 [Adiantum capillus-veneris]|uniref:Uncharacterized protein n=1 Tax=Adiantum capillus-veneris TaxID=13818 RepID=A0A9D4UPV7_ADICA|nr:hypothetical protein GOP47_0014146 [Adiantum capillus-veneris]